MHKATAEENPTWFAQADTFVANGPFMIESGTPDSEIVMATKEGDWGGESVVGGGGIFYFLMSNASMVRECVCGGS